MAAGHFDVIKGNEGEIQTVFGTVVSQRGVDSASSLTLAEKATLVKTLARRERSVVILTGATDLISDGARTFRLDNGHPLLGMVTGTGCTLGTTVSAMVAAWPGDKLLAAVAGATLFGVAAERAAARSEVRGPGTFVPTFLDELYLARKATADGDLGWLKLAKVEALDVQEEL